jgi:hypothetical protein
MELVNGKTYNIIDGAGNSQVVLSAGQVGPNSGVAALGSAVTTSSLTSVGTLTALDNSGNTTLGSSTTSNTVTINGSLVQNNNSSETAYASKSLPAADSGFYVRNGNGGTGTYAALGLIASSTTAASDQSFSIVAQAQASGLVPKVAFTQRDGNNSQNETMVFSPTGQVFINRTAQHASSSERLSVNGMTSIQFDSTSSASLYIFNEEATTTGNPIQPFIFCHDGSGIRAGLGIQRSTGKTFLNGQFGLILSTGASGVGGTPRISISSSAGSGAGTSVGNTTIVDQNLVIQKTATAGNGVGGITIGKDVPGVDGCISINSNNTGSDTDELGIEFLTHPSTAGSAAPEQSLLITHDGSFEFMSHSNTTGEQGAKLEWWNENHAGIMAKIAVHRTADVGAPADLSFFTSDNVDTASNSSEGNIEEIVRITSSKALRVGDSLTTNAGGRFQVVEERGGQQANDCNAYFETNANDWNIKTYYNSAGTHYHIQFLEQGTNRGMISGADGSDVTYSGGSDYRWKENVVDFTGTEGIDICKKLKPRKFNWIENREETGEINTVDGFIAHEVEEAGVLGAVQGEKDAVNEDGSIKGQMLAYGKMTPVLAAAIKGLIDKVETLEAKVAELES